jgi:hypothetical protein
MSMLRVIPAYRRLERAVAYQESESQRLSEIIEAQKTELNACKRQYEELVNKPKPRHLVFFHLLRTGGSSTWKALSEAGARQGLPICDIYHQARSRYGDNTAVHAAMYDFQHFARSRDCLIHHHAPYCIAPYFDNPINYTTILRDPVDRFISEVNHVRRILTGDLDSVHKAGQITPANEVRGLGWPQHLIDMAVDHSVSLSSLITQAAQHPHFSRYYTIWFSRLLDAELSKGSYHNSLTARFDLHELTQRIQAAFLSIGSFKRLPSSIQILARAYDLPDADTSGWINRRFSETILPELRLTLKPCFTDDYTLIQALNVDV